ncbi:uncharacterized protein LOC128549691 [Mercenaria mercenaria]|uniref:uncharacterized protein LOC128549691 n=1 Tax=Mercenaria mercenaria TaxID=6596 RepID=UPI00234EB598|nr:uncharacterized protein LOC128549691 [Mercenaria mercenaria]
MKVTDMEQIVLQKQSEYLIYSRQESSDEGLDNSRQTQDDVLQEVRERYTSLYEKSVFPTSDKTILKESEIKQRIESAVSPHPNDTSEDIRCASCSDQTRVECVSRLKKAQHICLPGNYSKKNIKLLRKQVHLYKHHAIVTNVSYITETKVKMTIIHFHSGRDGLHIEETTDVYDLTYDEIYIVNYTATSINSPDTVIERAKRILSQNKKGKFGKYDAFSCNCEHFATWCVIGKEECFQTEEIMQKLKTAICSVFGNGSYIAKVLVKAINTSADEIASTLTSKINIPEFVLGGTVVLYLLYCIFKTVQYMSEHKDRTLCASCKGRKLQELWLEFGVFLGTSAVSYIVLNFLLPLMTTAVGVPFMFLVLLLSLALQLSVPTILNALRRPFSCEKKIVERISEVEVGDIISFPYYNFYHDMVVTEVHECAKNPSKGKLRCVHYGLPSLLGRRVVIEDYFDIDLQNTMYLLDMKHLKTYSQEKVVTRARKRLGERKWSALSNRSDHMCFWAKLDLRPMDVIKVCDSRTIRESKCKEVSTLIIDVHLMHEIEPGDVVNYKGTTGILVDMRSLDKDVGREFEMTLVVYDAFWYVRRRMYKVDLNKSGIVLSIYHKIHCHTKAIRVQRAKQKVDTYGIRWTTAGFIEDIIMLQT